MKEHIKSTVRALAQVKMERPAVLTMPVRRRTGWKL